MVYSKTNVFYLYRLEYIPNDPLTHDKKTTIFHPVIPVVFPEYPGSGDHLRNEGENHIRQRTADRSYRRSRA